MQTVQTVDVFMLDDFAKNIIVIDIENDGKLCLDRRAVKSILVEHHSDWIVTIRYNDTFDTLYEGGNAQEAMKYYDSACNKVMGEK
jgi:hypothetical protein